MTFNDIAWGYLDEKQALPYAYSAERILRMLNTCACNGGNLLLNVGPKPDGSIPADAVKPLTEVGEWLKKNGEAVYGELHPNLLSGSWFRGGNGISGITYGKDLKSIYLWNWITPENGEMYFSGAFTKAVAVTKLSDGSPVDFEYTDDHRVRMKGLKKKEGEIVPVYKIEFEDALDYRPFHKYPQIWL